MLKANQEKLQFSMMLQPVYDIWVWMFRHGAISQLGTGTIWHQSKKSFFQTLVSFHHHHYAPGMCLFLFLEPSKCSVLAGVCTFFCSLVTIFHDLVHPSMANLWQLCHISALFSIPFSAFLFLAHQLLSVMPLLDPFLHPCSPHAPTIATFGLSETLPISLSIPVISRIF